MQTSLRPWLSGPLFILASGALTSHAEEAGKVLYVQGEVQILREGRTLSPRKGDSLNAGDHISTGVGKLQLRFVDGAIMALGTHSKFQIERYAYTPQQPEQSVAHTRLIEGGLRTVTGAVAKINKPGYQLETPTGVIGVRGTEIVIDGPKIITLAGVVTYDAGPASSVARTPTAPAQGATPGAANSSTGSKDAGGVGTVSGERREAAPTVVLPAGTSLGMPTANDAPIAVAQTKPVVEMPLASSVIAAVQAAASVDIPAAKESQQTKEITNITKEKVVDEAKTEASAPTTPPTTPPTPTLVSSTRTGGVAVLSDATTSLRSSVYRGGNADFQRWSNESDAQARLVGLSAGQMDEPGAVIEGSPPGFQSSSSATTGSSSDGQMVWGRWAANSTQVQGGDFLNTSQNTYWLYGQNPLAPPNSVTSPDTYLLTYRSIGYAGEVSVNGVRSPITQLDSTLSLNPARGQVALSMDLTAANGLSASYSGDVMKAGYNGARNIDIGGFNYTLRYFGSDASAPEYAGLGFRFYTNDYNYNTSYQGQGVVAYARDPAVAATTYSGGTTLLAADGLSANFSSETAHSYSGGNAVFQRGTDGAPRLLSLSGGTLNESVGQSLYLSSQTSTPVSGGNVLNSVSSGSEGPLNWGYWASYSYTGTVGSGDISSRAYWLHGQTPVNVPTGGGTLTYNAIGHAGELNGREITALSSTLTLNTGTHNLGLSASMATGDGTTANFSGSTTYAAGQQGSVTFIGMPGGIASRDFPGAPDPTTLNGRVQFYGSQANDPSHAGLVFAIKNGSNTTVGQGVVAYKK